eukprot:COSAG06_NODE_15105_length_1097_cov_0.818637_2_plen_207_part_01
MVLRSLAPCTSRSSRTPSVDGVDEDGAVFYQLWESVLAVRWHQCTYWTPDNNPTANTFMAVMWQDGGVMFHYDVMVQEHLSWSTESVGYEDASGTQGVQISYGDIPFQGDNYWIPPVCTDFPTPSAPSCNVEDLVVDWTGGFHASGHALFGAEAVDPTEFIDAVVIVADPLDGCMGVPMDGSAADPANIVGTFADGSMAGKVALIRR